MFNFFKLSNKNDNYQTDTDNRVRGEDRNLGNFSISFFLLANNLKTGFVRVIQQRHKTLYLGSWAIC
jgi:hypothetical protein